MDPLQMLIVLASQPTLLIKCFFFNFYHELHVGFLFSQERYLLGMVIHMPVILVLGS